MIFSMYLSGDGKIKKVAVFNLSSITEGYALTEGSGKELPVRKKTEKEKYRK